MYLSPGSASGACGPSCCPQARPPRSVFRLTAAPALGPGHPEHLPRHSRFMLMVRESQHR